MHTWAEIEAWATEKLNRSRNMNEGDLSEIETAKLRGAISMLKELLALPNMRKVLEAQANTGLPE